MKLKKLILIFIGYLGISAFNANAVVVYDSFTAYDGALSYGITYNYNTSRYEATVDGLNKSAYSITIPSSVTVTVPGGYNTIGAKVVRIRDNAFKWTNSFQTPYTAHLTSITILNSLIIGDGAFKNLPDLEVIDLGPNDIYGIENCSNLEEVKGTNVRFINSLKGCSKLTKLPDLDNLLQIYDNALEGCTSLETMPAMPKLKTIGKSAFKGCSSLQEIGEVPSLTTIGEKAFSNCSSLAGIRGDQWNVVTISDNAFEYCYVLSIIPKFSNLVKIGNYAFKYCQRLTKLDAAPSSIGTAAFHHCNNLYSVKSTNPELIPTNCQIGEYAFYNLEYLTDLNPMGGLTAVGSCAFKNCKSIEEINMTCQPNGNSIFAGCNALKNVNINGQYIPDSLFFDCKSLDYTIPENISKIGQYAFANCSSLADINIPKLLTINAGVFSGCNFREITIPESVQSIEAYAFSKCTNLKSVISLNTLPPECNKTVFADVNIANCSLKTPSNSISRYQSSNVWKDFGKHYCLDTDITSLSFPQTSYIGYPEEQITLPLLSIPDNIDTNTLSWTSDNEEVATVNDGIVCCHNIGTSKIIVSYGDNLSASCYVEVVKPVTELTIEAISPDVNLNNNHLEMFIGSTQKIKVNILPEDAYDKTLTWQSSNSNIADIYDDTIYAITIGEAELTVTAASGVQASLKTSVKPVIATSIEMNREEIVLFEGEQASLDVSFLPTNATSKLLKWESNDQTIASVEDDGTVHAIKTGACIISASTTDGSNLTAKCTVLVKPVEATGIVLNHTNAELYQFETLQLSATVVPTNTTDKTITWTSSDESIAAVSRYGLVTTNNIGVATITATCGSASSSCTISVLPIAAESLTLNHTTLQLKVGETTTLVASVYPENALNKDVVWISSDENIASIDENGVITAIALGNATITAKCGDIEATCILQVIPTPVEFISLNPDNIELKVGESSTLHAIVYPEDATDKTILWESSDETVVSVEDGTITAFSPGVSIITACCGECIATCLVSVVEVVPEEIALDITHAEINVGEVISLIATIQPEDAADKSITWESSNPDIATVSTEGEVTAMSPGEVIISATTVNGLSACCELTVLPTLVEEIILNPTEIQGVPGDVLRIKATILPENASNKTLIWESSNPEIACTDNGFVEIMQEGTCWITAKATDGSNVMAQCFLSGYSDIESILDDEDGVIAIYNAQGILIQENCHSNEIKNLKPGLYIIKTPTKSFATIIR